MPFKIYLDFLNGEFSLEVICYCEHIFNIDSLTNWNNLYIVLLFEIIIIINCVSSSLSIVILTIDYMAFMFEQSKLILNLQQNDLCYQFPNFVKTFSSYLISRECQNDLIWIVRAFWKWSYCPETIMDRWQYWTDDNDGPKSLKFIVVVLMI